MAKLLTVHSGLRPGELFLLRDGQPSSHMVVVAPLDRSHRFAVARGDGEQWVLVREISLNATGPIDVLMTFETQALAVQALGELTGALMEPEPGADRTAYATPDEGGEQPKWSPSKWIAILLATILVIGFGGWLAMGNKKAVEASAAPTVAPAPPAASEPTPAKAPTMNIPAASGVDEPVPAPWLPSEPAPSSPPTPETAQEKELSPGDDFARMINGN